MRLSTPLVVAAALIAGSVAVASAQEFKGQIGARQGIMRLNGLAMGTLAGMARGQMPYDAEKAQAAADLLVGSSQVSQSLMWPQGSDSDSVEGTRALPAIWGNYDDVFAKWEAFGKAAAAFQTVAASGQEALGPGLQSIGGACSACHDDYQKPRN